uniref:MFS domain-containing protein n=1 Tax=Syphacia muris TaxID=451379 RepID=A0A0N5B096_9BILA
MEKQSKPLIIESILKPGFYTLFISVLAELMLLSQLGNLTYMSYAVCKRSCGKCMKKIRENYSPLKKTSYAPKPTSCNGINISDTLTVKEACSELRRLEAEQPCKPTLKAQFYSVNTEFGYYCENTTTVKNSISYQTIGIIIGSIVFGQLSDLLGRKPVTATDNIQSMLLHADTSRMSFWNFSNGFCCIVIQQFSNANSFTWICAVFYRRTNSFLTVFAAFGELCFENDICQSVMLVYLVEMLPMKDRMWINAIVAWSPNYIIFAGIAYFSQTWRRLSQVSSACLIPAIIISFFTQESPRWLIQKEQYKTAEASLMRIIRFEDRKYKNTEAVKAIVANEKKICVERNTDEQRHYIWHLFTSNLTTSILNYGILFDMSQVGGSIYINNCIIGLARCLRYQITLHFRWMVNITFGYMDYKIKWFGRRMIYNISMIGMVVVLSTISLLEIFRKHIAESGSGILRYLSLSISIIASHLFIVLNVSSNELYPTSVRNTAFSFLQAVGRIGIVLSPQVFILRGYWDPMPYVFLLGLSSLTLLLYQIFIPETKNVPLHEIMPKPKNTNIPLQIKKSSGR